MNREELLDYLTLYLPGHIICDDLTITSRPEKIMFWADRAHTLTVDLKIRYDIEAMLAAAKAEVQALEQQLPEA
ncbi:MAG TPA: hypothetical protein VFM12_03170 [Gemmatimonadales bacterium]|nr:hypothetical protein [Gemmatimonadales bacterium]